MNKDTRRIHLLAFLLLASCGAEPTTYDGGPTPEGASTATACLRAQEALTAAWLECGSTTPTDLQCDEHKADREDCAATYDRVAETASCVDGQVVWDLGVPCQPTPP